MLLVAILLYLKTKKVIPPATFNPATAPAAAPKIFGFSPLTTKFLPVINSDSVNAFDDVNNSEFVQQFDELNAFEVDNDTKTEI